MRLYNLPGGPVGAGLWVSRQTTETPIDPTDPVHDPRNTLYIAGENMTLTVAAESNTLYLKGDKEPRIH